MNRTFRVVVLLALLAVTWAGTAFALRIYKGPTELRGTVVQVFGGNSFAIYNGGSTSVVVLEGVRTPHRGEEHFLESANYLHKMLYQKKVKVLITRKARFITYGIVSELDENINVNAQVLAQPFAEEETAVALGGVEKSLTLRGNEFRSTVAGFSITKPGDWVFLSAQDVEASRMDIRLEDRELELAIKKRESVPLVVIARYPEPYEGLNSSVSVTTKSSGGLLGRDPASLMEAIVPVFEKAFSDFTVVEGVDYVMIDGRKSAYMKAVYTLTDVSGRGYKAVSHIYLVPRGTVMFIIDCSALASDEAKVAGAFDQILSSIKIAR